MPAPGWAQRIPTSALRVHAATLLDNHVSTPPEIHASTPLENHASTPQARAAELLEARDRARRQAEAQRHAWAAERTALKSAAATLQVPPFQTSFSQYNALFTQVLVLENTSPAFRQMHTCCEEVRIFMNHRRSWRMQKRQHSGSRRPSSGGATSCGARHNSRQSRDDSSWKQCRQRLLPL